MITVNTENVVMKGLQAVSQANNKAKMQFLHQQIEHLEMVVEEMSQNCLLLREVNSHLMQNHCPDTQTLLSALNEQNRALEVNYSNLWMVNGKLSSKVLLLQQIMSENSKEYEGMLNVYQQKIIELRRLIQDKEGYIQLLENKQTRAQGYNVKQTLQRVGKHQEGVIASGTFGTNLHLFDDIDTLKTVIWSLNLKNQKLLNDNKSLQEKLYQSFREQGVSQKSRSRRQEYSEEKPDDMFDNVMKRSSNFPTSEMKKTQSAAKCEDFEYFGEESNPGQKCRSILQQIESGLLREKIEQLRNKLSAERTTNIKISSAYRVQAKTIEDLKTEVKALKFSLKEMKMKKTRLYCRPNNSQRKSSLPKDFTAPDVQERKQYWLHLKGQQNPESCNYMVMEHKLLKSKRSLSCDVESWDNEWVGQNEKKNNREIGDESIKYALTKEHEPTQGSLLCDISAIPQALFTIRKGNLQITEQHQEDGKRFILDDSVL